MTTHHTTTGHDTHDTDHGGHDTPRAEGSGWRGAYIASLAGAWVLGALATFGISTCSKNNSQGNRFDPINTRWGAEQIEYDNNMTEVSMERVIDSLMMIQWTHTSLQADAFQGLYTWLSEDVFKGKTKVWQPMTWFDNNKHAHKNGNMGTHYEMMLDEIHGEKVIVIRWHAPTPTPAQKAKWHVSDHKVAFSQPAEWDTRIKRTDYYSDKQHPERTYITTFASFQKALEELWPVFK